MTVSGDWTYEKSWSEPKKVTIVYESPIDQTDIAKGSQQESVDYEDHQWSEVHTQYQTFEYVDEENTPRTQMLATKKIRTQHLTAVAVCANFFKWTLEAPMRGDTWTQKIQNKKLTRQETTEYAYDKTPTGWTLKEETTKGDISGFEYLGSLPIKDFRPWALNSGSALSSDLNRTYQSSHIYKSFHATNKYASSSPTANTKAKRVYSRSYTKVMSMYAFTQEGQQYLDQVLSKENGAKDDNLGGGTYWRSRHAWDSGKEITSDGSSMNSSIGQLQIEEMPNEYDDAEEELNNDDDMNDDDADSRNGGGEDDNGNQNSGQATKSIGSSIGFAGGDLVKQWDEWGPYDAQKGSQFPGSNNNNKWSGDVLKAADTKPQYNVHVGGVSGRPSQRGIICLNSSSPGAVSKISMSAVSWDGYVTAPFQAGQKILINSPSNLCTYWYLIRKVTSNDQVAEVQFMENITQSSYLNYACRLLEEDWRIKALVTSVTDRGSRIFTMPYAPDDYMKCRDGRFVLVPGGAQDAASDYVTVQMRLLEGQTRGVNVTTSLRQIPSEPFAAVYLNMLGTSIYGRTNGTSWAFNDSGCVVSTDIIYGGHAGRDGSPQGRQARTLIREQQAACPVEQSEGWIDPPDNLRLENLPYIEPSLNPLVDVRKQDSISVPDDFDPVDPDCGLWTDLLPIGQDDEVPLETVTTDHIFVSQAQPILVGRVRARASFKGFAIGEQPEQPSEHIYLRVTSKASNEYVDSVYKPTATITRTRTYPILIDSGSTVDPKPPDLDCKLLVKPGFGGTAE